MILWFPIKKATQLSLFDRMNQPVKQVLVHEKTGKTHMQGYHVSNKDKERKEVNQTELFEKKIKTNPSKMKFEDFIPMKETVDEQRTPYMKDGELLSKIDVPQPQTKYKVGQWRIDDFDGKYGHEIEQLRIVDFNELIPGESTESNKRKLQQYEKRLELIFRYKKST